MDPWYWKMEKQQHKFASNIWAVMYSLLTVSVLLGHSVEWKHPNLPRTKLNVNPPIPFEHPSTFPLFIAPQKFPPWAVQIFSTTTQYART